MSDATSGYIGRFAPSPSGPLHFGSLICALASYIHARQHHGKWLVRIEDVDTPRIDAKMSPVILTTLQKHGMQWDDEVTYQSLSHARYEKALMQLKAQNEIYACICSRKEINARAPYYDRKCRDAHHDFEANAIRWKNQHGRSSFIDLHFGEAAVEQRMAKEDPVLKRADGIYAYHLAVVCDDIAQKITHIVRGVDLIDTTPLHISLFAAFEKPAPAYLHIPIATNTQGQKLSKQHHAKAIEDDHALENVKSALEFIGICRNKIKHLQSVDSLIQYAVENWKQDMLSYKKERAVSQSSGVYHLQEQD